MPKSDEQKFRFRVCDHVPIFESRYYAQKYVDATLIFFVLDAVLRKIFASLDFDAFALCFIFFNPFKFFNTNKIFILFNCTYIIAYHLEKSKISQA